MGLSLIYFFSNRVTSQTHRQRGYPKLFFCIIGVFQFLRQTSEITFTIRKPDFNYSSRRTHSNYSSSRTRNILRTATYGNFFYYYNQLRTKITTVYYYNQLSTRTTKQNIPINNINKRWLLLDSVGFNNIIFNFFLITQVI